MVWENLFLRPINLLSKFQEVPKTATGKISCLELVFLKNFITFDQPQGGIRHNTQKGHCFISVNLVFTAFSCPLILQCSALISS